MSFFDKITAALTPPESDEDRHEAREKARSLSTGNDWLGAAISHHEQIEEAFGAARSAGTPEQARTAVRALADVLIPHSVAEELVLYPTLVMEGHKVDAAAAYQEQQMAKVEMAELEKLTPLSQDWVDKLEHIRGAVLHHIYSEESDWFPRIMEETSPADLSTLNMRFAEEFGRYKTGL